VRRRAGDGGCRQPAADPGGFGANDLVILTWDEDHGSAGVSPHAFRARPCCARCRCARSPTTPARDQRTCCACRLPDWPRTFDHRRLRAPRSPAETWGSSSALPLEPVKGRNSSCARTSSASNVISKTAGAGGPPGRVRRVTV
jgi:hypothetical protein